METKDKVKLRSRAKLMEPQVRVGKNGLTESVIEQVRRLLVKRELVKIKLLRSFIDNNDRKKAAAELAKKLGADIIDRVGFVIVLYKKRPDKGRPVKKRVPARKSSINQVRSRMSRQAR